ncbi:hypothetical protein MK139_11000 [bacterium]|nr:hypothetical protein [bacterium]
MKFLPGLRLHPSGVRRRVRRSACLKSYEATLGFTVGWISSFPNESASVPACESRVLTAERVPTWFECGGQ